MKVKPDQKNKNNIEYLQDNFVIDASNFIKDDTGEVTKFTARVQQADKMNLNRRIYPKDALLEAIEFYQKKIDAKQSFVLVDHPSFFSGATFDRIGARILKIWFDEADGFVYIEGVFVKNENFTKYIKPVIDAGGALPFSARGYAINDGNPEWSDEKQAWVFRKGYRLAAYDFVVDPAMEEATTTSLENKQSDITNHNKLKEEHKMFKTVDELRAEYPALVKQLDDQIDTLKKANDTHEKTIADVKKQNETITADLATKSAALDKANAEIAKAKFDMGVTELMKDHKYAAFIKIPATVNTLEDAKAHIEAETAKFDAFKASIATPAPTTPAPKQDANDGQGDGVVPTGDPAVINLDGFEIDNAIIDEYDRLARS